ncbi:MAG: M36 family metallopeptidase, partial [Bacteroidota bacterium]
RADCLTNSEQQGEGWSDFFALITSVRPGDTGETLRGIGNYSDRQPVTGGGIRRVPYTTDLTFNDHVMDDILNTTAPHPLGEVWATAIWDLYWAMVDIYGYDEDLINGTGGNNMAIQIVMDGMANQRCNPGFMDARDALFTADFLNYDGIHECLIWEVFARRGMGEDADQRDRFDRNDNTVGFEIPLYCSETLKVLKSADRDLIVAGEDIEFTLTVRNDKTESVTGVMVEDELPAGMTYIPGSASGATVTDNGDNLVFDIGDMDPEDDVTITYSVTTTTDNRSIQLFYDGIEDGDGNWELEAPAGFDIWDISDANPNQGESSWFVANTGETNDQIIRLIDPFEVNGVNPTIRFYHDYDTQPLADGGLVEISRNGGMSWETVNDAYIRGDYRGELAAQTLFSPNFRAFWGSSDGYIDSYIDLSAFQGETISVRFRFASNGDTGATGWYMDDFEVMDKFAYEGEACVTSNEGDLDCASVPEGGVIVDTDLSNSTDDPVRDPQVMQVYPNPTNNVLNVALNLDLASTIDIQIVNAAGAVVAQWRDQGLQGQMISLNVSDLPTGFYVLQVNTPDGIYTEKVTIQ